MEIRQLNTFIHVAQFQSFSKAAEHLGYSQSALTVQIRLLEKELNTRLFDRMGRQVMLTAQGKQFLENANKILYEVTRAQLSMEIDDELKNPLRIGTIESLCTAKLPPIIRYFRHHHPQVALQITIATPEELIEMMEHNDLDLIYILDAPRWSDQWYKVMEVAEPIVFVCSPYSPLTQKRELYLKDIIEEPFFLTEKNANYRRALDLYLACNHISLSPMLEISDTAFIIKMLQQNDGLSYLPLFAVQKYIQDRKLAVLDVKDVNIAMFHQLFYHKGKFKTREMDKFIQLACADLMGP